MLRIMNPKPLQLSRSGASGEGDDGVAVGYWENARPLIEELEQTVNFAERKCGDLMQQLNMCKEYYEKRSTERTVAAANIIRRRKPRRRIRRKPGRTGGTKSSSENESGRMTTTQGTSDNISMRLRNKINAIGNEIKEANRKILLKETCFPICCKSIPKNTDKNYSKGDSENVENGNVDVISLASTGDGNRGKESKLMARRPRTMLTKKRSFTSANKHITQKFKLRSKSLPQGVRRKFGFGSFVEIVDKQRSAPVSVKSRPALPRESKANASGGGLTSGSEAKSRGKEEIKNGNRRIVATNAPTQAREASKGETFVNVIERGTKNALSCSNFSTELGSILVKDDSYCVKEVGTKYCESMAKKQKCFLLASRQLIPFTICRTAKTFNLGLNIQQVLSLIKSKRHSAMLQAIIKDNIRTARSVMHKTDQSSNASHKATSKRIASATSFEKQIPLGDEGDNSSASGNSCSGGSKCKMLTCTQSVKLNEERVESLFRSSLPFSLDVVVQRPEDVWVVEQPDCRQALQPYRSRCTCFPTKNSVDYHKVLKQYSRMKACETETGSFCSGFVTSKFCSMSALPQISDSSSIGTKLDLKGIQDDFNDLIRRYERVEEIVAEKRGEIDMEADAELYALQLELSGRDEEWRIVANCYNQFAALGRKVADLRGRMRSWSVGRPDSNQTKSLRWRKNPFRPTPSMTLTRILRQIQRLQLKIEEVDAPSTA